MTVADIENRFTYHAPIGDQPAKYEAIRNHAKAFALLLNLACPDGREKSLAFTALEEAVMWANAGVARAQDEQADTNTLGQAGKPLDPRR